MGMADLELFIAADFALCNILGFEDKLRALGGRRIALSTTFTALHGMSRIAHSITSGSPLWQHRSQPTICPYIPSGVPGD